MSSRRNTSSDRRKHRHSNNNSNHIHSPISDDDDQKNGIIPLSQQHSKTSTSTTKRKESYENKQKSTTDYNNNNHIEHHEMSEGECYPSSESHASADEKSIKSDKISFERVLSSLIHNKLTEVRTRFNRRFDRVEKELIQVVQRTVAQLDSRDKFLDSKEIRLGQFEAELQNKVREFFQQQHQDQQPNNKKPNASKKTIDNDGDGDSNNDSDDGKEKDNKRAAAKKIKRSFSDSDNGGGGGISSPSYESPRRIDRSLSRSPPRRYGGPLYQNSSPISTGGSTFVPKKICHFYLSRGGCFKGDQCTFRHPSSSRGRSSSMTKHSHKHTSKGGDRSRSRNRSSSHSRSRSPKKRSHSHSREDSLERYAKRRD